MANERASALERTSGALSKRAEKQVSSTTQEREWEHRGTSIFLIELRSDLEAAIAKEHID